MNYITYMKIISLIIPNMSITQTFQTAFSTPLVPLGHSAKGLL